jgi:hypothetical protein
MSTAQAHTHTFVTITFICIFPAYSKTFGRRHEFHTINDLKMNFDLKLYHINLQWSSDDEHCVWIFYYVSICRN